MTFVRKGDRRNWYNTIPVQGEDRRFKPNPDTFDIDKLQENEIDYGNGTVMAKIPVIEGHIYRRADKDRNNIYIELVLGRTFDKEKQQGRNSRVIIGTDASGLFPGMMVINKNYRQYFDREGLIINEELKQTLAEETRIKEEKKQKREAAKREKERTVMKKKIAESTSGIDFESLTDNEWKALGDVLEEVMTQDGPAGSEILKAETKEGQSRTTPESLIEAMEKKDQDNTTKKKAKRTVQEIQQSIEEKEKELIKKLEETDRLRKELDHIQTVKKIQFEQAVRDHIQLLNNIFFSHYQSVREQSKRHTNAIMSPKEVRTINTLLAEFKDYFKDSETEEYLLLAEEPVVNAEGELIGGTTYGEMELLMNAFHWTIVAYKYGNLNEKF